MSLGWFGPHKIGWGVGPRTWQGWLITLLLVVAEVFMDRIPGGTPQITIWARPALFVAFLAVMALTYRSDKPRP